MAGDEERAKVLRGMLADAEHRLHVLEHPMLQSRIFSALIEELGNLETRVPKTPDSPTRRRPVEPREMFEVLAHERSWPPLATVESVAELRSHHARVASLERSEVAYVASATMPGAEVVLTYERGVLARAVLRGDGESGEDVTDNVRTVRSCPLGLRRPGTVTESRVTKLTGQPLGPSTLQPVPQYPDALNVRASVVMRTADLTALDRRRVDSGEPPYILPRAGVLGSLRRLDPRVTASRPLKLFALGCDRPPPGIDSEWQLLAALKSWGFALLPVTWRCKGLSEVLDFVSTLQQVAPAFEYPLDGGTLTVNRCGFGPSATVPGAVRLMFPPPGRPAVVTRTYCAVGRSGSVLPVALLERSPDHELPVPERAPVPAYDGTRMLAVESGTTVRVRPGSVAPVMGSERIEVGSPPVDRCPTCRSALPASADEPFRTCVNSACIGRARARLLHLIGPRGLRLESLTAKTIDQLLAEYGPMDAADVLTMDPAALDRIAPGVGSAFEQELADAKRLPLWRFLYLVAIPHVSEHASRAIAHHVFSLGALEDLGEAGCRGIPDISPEAAAGLAAWLSADGPRVIRCFTDAGFRILDAAETFPAPFLGRRVALAGDFEHGTSFATDEIERRGGIVQPRVGRTTDLLVHGRGGEREFDAAAMYNIPVIEEAAFRALLRDTS